MIRLVKTDRKPNFSGVTPASIAAVTLFVFTILAAHLVGHQYEADLTPCVFKLITGEPCFLCGGTRASLHLIGGDPVAAFKFNPLVTVVFSFVILALILKFAFSKKLILYGPFRNRRLLWFLTITIVLANWVYIIRTLP